MPAPGTADASSAAGTGTACAMRLLLQHGELPPHPRAVLPLQAPRQLRVPRRARRGHLGPQRASVHLRDRPGSYWLVRKVGENGREVAAQVEIESKV
jgi:hypothetical protein